MGCQNSKQENPSQNKMSLNEMRERKREQDEIKYQYLLRKLDKYIRTHNVQRQLKQNGGKFFTVYINNFQLNDKQFNKRNVSQIKVDPGRDFYPKFYPKSDQDITDPHFL